GYSGETTSHAGRIALRSNTAGLPDASALTIAAGGTYELGQSETAFNDTIGSLAGGGNVELSTAGPLLGIATGSALIAGGNNASTTFSGVISGAGGRFRKTGTGTLTLSGANTYTGFTDIQNGALLLTSGNAISDGSTVFFNTAATGAVALNLNGVD